MWRDCGVGRCGLLALAHLQRHLQKIHKRTNPRRQLTLRLPDGKNVAIGGAPLGQHSTRGLVRSLRAISRASGGSPTRISISTRASRKLSGWLLSCKLIANPGCSAAKRDTQGAT